MSFSFGKCGPRIAATMRYSSSLASTATGSTIGNYAIKGAHGVYGTLRVAAPGNVPGSRDGEVGWTDKNGNLWLFGGQGFDSSIAPARGAGNFTGE